MKVLVTGGGGFIGSHIVDALVETGHSVAVVDDFSSGSRENVSRAASIYDVSITDLKMLERAFAQEKPEVVNHHAAHTSVRRSVADPSFDAGVNIIGTINLLQLCVQYAVKQLIFASTCAVYAEPEYLPMDEDHPVGPQSAYGASKYAAECYVRLYSEIYGLRNTIFRYGNVFGPRQNPQGEAGVVAIFTGQLLGSAGRGVRPTIFGDGTKTRDYIYVGDVVRANLLAMERDGGGGLFNLGRGVEVSDFEIFDAVRKAAGATLEPIYGQRRPGEAMKVSLDATRAKKTLGWAPEVSLQEGLRRAVASYGQPPMRSAG